MQIDRSVRRACLASLVAGSLFGALCVAAPSWAQAPAPGIGDTLSGASFETADYRAVMSPGGNGIAHFVLKHPRYERDDAPIDIVTTDQPQFMPLHQRLEGVEGGDKPLKWMTEQTENGVRLRAKLGGLDLSRSLTPGRDPYQVWSTLRVRNTGGAPMTFRLVEEGHHYVRRAQESGGFIGGRSPFVTGATCYVGDTAEREDRDDIVEASQEGQPLTFPGKGAFGAVDNVYFTQAIAAHDAEYESCRLVGSDRGGSIDSPDGSLISVELTRPETTLQPGAEQSFKTLYYLGPKTPENLQAAGHKLAAATDVGGIPGINTIAQGLAGLLKVIYGKVGNWGLAIILLTFVVKLVLYPLTAKSFESMASMRRLKPEIDALNEKFANDREKKGAAMMELYRKHRINPLGGCLPQLLQLPIWWALYMSLSTNVELFRQPFFGFWQDLTAPDPYYVLPVALGLLMFVQQKLTPTTMDPAQAKMMMYMMPTMITAFMLFLPAGLCLYMFTNSVLTIAQQRVIERRLNAKQAASTPALREETSAPAPAVDSAKRRKRRGRA